MLEEIFLRLREIFSLSLVNDLEKAYVISKWVADEPVDPIDEITSTILREQDYWIVLDTQDWSAEILGFDINDALNSEKKITDIFLSIRYKNGSYRDLKCLHGEEATVENVVDFINKDRQKEAESWRKYQDSKYELKRFDGDIVITDPCYVNEESWNDPEVDIFTGHGFSKYFGNTYIYGSTIYGDWSCTTHDVGSVDPKDIMTGKEELIPNPIGNFCADAGLVCVVYLDRTSERFRNTYGDWTRTIIRDFHGYIQYAEHNREIHIIGYSDDKLHNFYTEQTGL